MKKIFLTVIALLSMASASVFGMYGVDSDWIDFLTHGNQFRARLETLGFVLGNDTIKGTFGFDAPNSYLGQIIKTTNAANNPTRLDLMPNISAGIGYTSSAISVGVGYTISIADQWRGVDGKAHQQAAHTPTLVLNALDNALRIAIPIQVFHTTGLKSSFSYQTPFDASASPEAQTNSITAVSLDAQFRYYTGLEALPQVRLYIKYGMASSQRKTANETLKNKFESFGFDFRLFFGSIVEEVALQPLFKVAFDTALDKYFGSKSITAVGVARNTVTGTTQSGQQQSDNNKAINKLNSFNSAKVYDANPYQLLILGGLGLTANSDIVSLFLRPELGLKINEDGYNSTKLDIGLGWNVYAELYLTPIKNLEWYMEFSLGNDDKDYNVAKSKTDFNMAASTGVTWYLPGFN